MIGNNKEVWKDIPGFEGSHQASNMGRVRSLDRTVVYKDGRERFYKSRVLEGSVNKTTGYRQVRLSVNDKGKTYNTSQLVAMAFLGHTPDGHTKVVDHINGNRLDDRVENLRIVTHRANSSTCFRKDSKTLSSRFTGVSWFKRGKNWFSSIQYEGEIIYLGSYDNELEASKSYQKALSEINNGVFNPDDYKPDYTSRYKGVYFHKKSNKWRAQIQYKGKQKYLGSFQTELEAHNAYQKALTNQL